MTYYTIASPCFEYGALRIRGTRPKDLGFARSHVIMFDPHYKL